MDIVVFACNWSGLSSVEAATQAGLSYPSSVKVVRVNCLSRIHSGLMLKAFEMGAGGVMLLGCPRGDCHYDSSTEWAGELVSQARKVLHLLGIDPKRLALVEVPLGEGNALARQVCAFARRISEAGSSQVGPSTICVAINTCV